jgi:hypothetical protein
MDLILMEKNDPYWLRIFTIIALALLAWAFMILAALILWEAGKFLVIGWSRRLIAAAG